MRQFLVILGLTALVWLGVSMSEERDCNYAVKVRITGYDTVRYAIVEADSALLVNARLTGFNAMLNSLFRRHPAVDVEMADNHHAVAVADIEGLLRRSISGATRVDCITDSLRFRLDERASRVFEPLIDRVQFSFSGQHGLYGEPTIAPHTVTLYGPRSVLDSIESLHVAEASIEGIDKSGDYRLPLEPVWNTCPDVHPSCREVTVSVPVEAYVECEYRVPVSVSGVDSAVDVMLYPEFATVRAWVAQRDLGGSPDFRVSVDYGEILAGKEYVEARIEQFPSHVRLRSVEPAMINCVILQ
ncbi:MAG: YbbR-like domain-containing protein [Bacteroidales bacterium]|nr:YbbR-like domain-containing protein [Bacteroidales bacterium]